MQRTKFKLVRVEKRLKRTKHEHKLVRTKKSGLVRTKHSLMRTKHKLVKIISLRRGQKFKSELGSIIGTLEYVNDCRARVRLASKTKVKIKDAEFSRERFLDISPATLVYEL